MPHARRRSFCRLVALVLTLVGPGIAAAQAPKGTADLKSIVGKWSGTGQSSLGTSPLEWTIKEDGTVEIIAGTPNGPRTGTGKMSVKDGKFFYETGSSSGIVTLEEDGGRRVLKYDAVFKRDSSRGSAELTPAR